MFPAGGSRVEIESKFSYRRERLHVAYLSCENAGPATDFVCSHHQQRVTFDGLGALGTDRNVCACPGTGREPWTLPGHPLHPSEGEQESGGMRTSHQGREAEAGSPSGKVIWVDLEASREANTGM